MSRLNVSSVTCHAPHLVQGTRLCRVGGKQVALALDHEPPATVALLDAVCDHAGPDLIRDGRLRNGRTDAEGGERKRERGKEGKREREKEREREMYKRENKRVEKREWRERGWVLQF
jgi:hypothetical protein